MSAVPEDLYLLSIEHTFVSTTHANYRSLATRGARPSTMPPLLTDRQQQIWNYLIEYVDLHGYPPTVREIGEEVGLASPSTVHAHLANLERAGLLHRDPTKPRALELIGRDRAEPSPAAVESLGAARLPLLGEIAAGAPLLAEQNIEEYLTFPSSTGGDFLLRVRGDSMIEAGILDGDLEGQTAGFLAEGAQLVVGLQKVHARGFAHAAFRLNAQGLHQTDGVNGHPRLLQSPPRLIVGELAEGIDAGAENDNRLSPFDILHAFRSENQRVKQIGFRECGNSKTLQRFLRVITIHRKVGQNLRRRMSVRDDCYVVFLL